MSIDIDDSAVPGVAPAATTPPPAPAAPPPPPVDPKAIAREILNGLTQAQQRGMSQQRKTATEIWVEQQVAKGTNPQVISDLLALREAERMDGMMAAQQQAPQNQYEFQQAKINELVVSVFDEIAEEMPAVQEAKFGLIQRFHKEFHSNDAYKEQIARIDDGQLPQKKVIAQAMAKTIDGWLKTIPGAVPRQQPVSRAQSKPSSTARSGDGIEKLDPAQQKFYKVFKGDLVKKHGKEKGESLALERAKQMYDG